MTQKVDRTDPILGFFHRWLEEFAEHCERVTVIGQLVGEYDLPPNVHVVSLGKEAHRSRWQQILRFWYLQWSRRGQYDVALVHMTPIWVVLGAPLWCLVRKPMYLWYEARGARWSLRLALKLVRKVFSASTHGMPIHSRRSHIVGHGIDTEAFRSQTDQREKDVLLTVGRITTAKHFEEIVTALSLLPSTYRLQIVGVPITAADFAYKQQLVTQIHDLGLDTRVQFSSVSQTELVPLLQQAQLFMHTSETGLDKVVLEAMACGCLVVSTNPGAQLVLPTACHATSDSLVAVAQRLLALSSEQLQSLQTQLRQTVEQDHNLTRLVKRLVQEMS